MVLSVFIVFNSSFLPKILGFWVSKSCWNRIWWRSRRSL